MAKDRASVVQKLVEKVYTITDIVIMHSWLHGTFWNVCGLSCFMSRTKYLIEYKH